PDDAQREQPAGTAADATTQHAVTVQDHAQNHAQDQPTEPVTVPAPQSAEPHPDRWGRGDADGTVYGRTAEGERLIGSWQAGGPARGPRPLRAAVRRPAHRGRVAVLASDGRPRRSETRAVIGQTPAGFTGGRGRRR